MDSNANGYVGLKNEGTSDILNTVIQALYHLPSFRQLVYDVPRQEESGKKEISLIKALQRLFYRLDYSQEKAVDTREFTKLLHPESFLLYDHFGLWGTLIQHLEKEIKFSKEEEQEGKESPLKELFFGSFVDFLKCIHVDEETRREEDFTCLELVVENSDSLETCLAKFIERERLEGDNQIRTAPYGKQDVDKFILLKTLPLVLTFSLKRFFFDFEEFKVKRVSSYLKIPDEVDLSPFLCPEVELENTRFHLYSVHVHAGTMANTGHTFSILQPFPHTTDEEAPWFTFDDGLISRFPKENLQNFFGGNDGSHQASAIFVMFIREDFVEKNNFEPRAPSWLAEEMAKENLVGRARNVKSVKKQPRTK